MYKRQGVHQAVEASARRGLAEPRVYETEFDEDALFVAESWSGAVWRGVEREKQVRAGNFHANLPGVENVGRRSDGSAATRTQSAPPVKVRSGHYEYPEPLKEVRLDPGFNCMVSMKIGSVKFRVCIDSGGARSCIRTAFRKQLEKSAKTKCGVRERVKLAHTIQCTGMCDNMVSTEITRAVELNLMLEGLDPNGGIETPLPVLITPTFVELDNASDALLIGFPEMVQYGVRFFADADGNVWVDFEKLGVTLLAEGNLYKRS